jgi:hypothetical protein
MGTRTVLHEYLAAEVVDGRGNAQLAVTVCPQPEGATVLQHRKDHKELEVDTNGPPHVKATCVLRAPLLAKTQLVLGLTYPLGAA